MKFIEIKFQFPFSFGFSRLCSSNHTIYCVPRYANGNCASNIVCDHRKWQQWHCQFDTMAYLTSVHLVVHEKNWEKSMKSMAIVKCSCFHRFRFNFCIQPTGIRIRIHRHIYMSNIHTFAMTLWQKQSFSKHKYTSQYSLPDLSEQNRHVLEQRWQRPIKKIERDWKSKSKKNEIKVTNVRDINDEMWLLSRKYITTHYIALGRAVFIFQFDTRMSTFSNPLRKYPRTLEKYLI